MFIITCTYYGEKYYYDGAHFTMNIELSVIFSDAFDAIFELCSLQMNMVRSYFNLKIEEI